MTMNVTGRKASLYATAMAISLVALSGTAHAQSASNGTYSTWAKKTEGLSTVTKTSTTKATLTQAQIDALDLTEAQKAVIAQKNYVTATLTGALATTTKTAYDAVAAAVADETAKSAAVTLATAKLSGGSVTVSGTTTVYTGATAAKTAADNEVIRLLGVKSTADGAVTSASSALAAAQTAQSELTSSATADQIAAAKALVARRTQELNLKVVEQKAVDTAYTDAVAAAQKATTAYTTAITAKSEADNALTSATAAKTIATNTFNTALASDTGFLSTLVAVNAAAGTTFAATYDGLASIATYDDQALVTKYASNGVARANAILTESAASSNQNISMASGALTGSAAALEIGANYETEVLGALVNHEGRIVANTTAISALDVRTTANAAAITAETAARIAADTAEKNERIAEDKRIVGLVSAETTARLAQNAELRDRISSSTATAIALGGAALLPDMGFTLSGNVSFYEGAQAMALNAAAKVGPNAYVTAAVGGGLNKHGSVGGRVGFVFGF